MNADEYNLISKDQLLRDYIAAIFKDIFLPESYLPMFYTTVMNLYRSICDLCVGTTGHMIMEERFRYISVIALFI